MRQHEQKLPWLTLRGVRSSDDQRIQTLGAEQDEESDINFFYLVKKGRLQVIRRVDVQRLRDAKDSIQEETPAAVLRHSPFPNAESVDAKIDQMFELQSGQKDVLRSGLSRKAIETPVKEEPTGAPPAPRSSALPSQQPLLVDADFTVLFDAVYGSGRGYEESRLTPQCAQ